MTTNPSNQPGIGISRRSETLNVSIRGRKRVCAVSRRCCCAQAQRILSCWMPIVPFLVRGERGAKTRTKKLAARNSVRLVAEACSFSDDRQDRGGGGDCDIAWNPFYRAALALC